MERSGQESPAESGAPAAGASGEGGGIQFRDFMNSVRRNLWTILGCTLLSAGGTAYFAWTARAVYEATTTIHVDASRPATPEFAFITEMLRASDVNTEMALLGARTLMEATVDSLDLQVTVDRPSRFRREDLFSEASASRITTAGRYDFRRTADAPGAPYAITDAEGRETGRLAPGEAIVFNGVRLVLAPAAGGDGFPPEFSVRTFDRREALENLIRNTRVERPDREASVMSASYRDTDRGLVRDVPNVVASLYLVRRNQSKRLEADSTVAFLERQIVEYNDQLQKAEEDRLAFQQGEQVVDLQAEGEAQVRLRAEAQADRRRLENQLSSLTSVLDVIQGRGPEANPGRAAGDRSPYRALAGFTTFLENQAVTELLSDLNQIETDRTAQLEFRTAAHPEVVAMDAQIRQLEDELYQLAVNYRDNLEAQIRSADAQLAQFGEQLERIPENSVELMRLEREVENLSQIYGTLRTRLQQARVAQAVESGDVRIVDAAIEPTRPIRPRKVRAMALAVLFGLVLGATVGAARDHLDERIHSRQQLAGLTNLPVLATIPRIPGANGKKRGAGPGRYALPFTAGSLRDRGSPVSEAFRAFRTNITFLNVDQPPQAVLVTSPGPSEGKSTCTCNLAVTLAQQDASVLLLDGDLRRGVVHKMLGERRREPGLTNVLKGDASLDEAVRAVELPDGKSLHILTAGAPPPNPSELLGSRNMETLVETLRSRYGVVLFDSPPLNLVTDAAVLGTLVDGVILVARAGVTHQGALRFARGQLEAVAAPLSGVVLNETAVGGRGRYYGDGSEYGYYRRYYKTLDT